MTDDGSTTGRRRTALRLAAGWDRLLPISVVAALALLAAGLFLPVMTVDRFFVFPTRFSIVESMRALYAADEYFLFAAILLFSVVFPVAKLACCLLIWCFADIHGSGIGRLIAWIDHLGRWSMLDVFLLAILLVTVRSASVGAVHTDPGLYLFAAAVILSIVTVQWIKSAGRRLAAQTRS